MDRTLPELQPHEPLWKRLAPHEHWKGELNDETDSAAAEADGRKLATFARNPRPRARAAPVLAKIDIVAVSG